MKDWWKTAKKQFQNGLIIKDYEDKHFSLENCALMNHSLKDQESVLGFKFHVDFNS